jgi:hypothetical protein
MADQKQKKMQGGPAKAKNKKSKMIEQNNARPKMADQKFFLKNARRSSKRFKKKNVR